MLDNHWSLSQIPLQIERPCHHRQDLRTVHMTAWPGGADVVTRVLTSWHKHTVTAYLSPHHHTGHHHSLGYCLHSQHSCEPSQRHPTSLTNTISYVVCLIRIRQLLQCCVASPSQGSVITARYLGLLKGDS